MPSTVLTLPTPPSVNNAYANVPGRGRVPSARLRSWRNVAGWDLKTQHITPVPGKVQLVIEVERQGNRRTDISNRVKCVEDLLVELKVIEDDRHVERVIAEWSDTIKGCRVTVAPWAEAHSVTRALAGLAPAVQARAA